MKHYVNCCPRMLEKIDEGETLWVSNHEPFDTDKNRELKVYFLSDGGQRDWFPIDFCPFCGSKIEIQTINPIKPC